LIPTPTTQESCVAEPSTIEMLDELEAALAAAVRALGSPQPEIRGVRRPVRSHPFSRIEDL